MYYLNEDEIPTMDDLDELISDENELRMFQQAFKEEQQWQEC